MLHSYVYDMYICRYICHTLIAGQVGTCGEEYHVVGTRVRILHCSMNLQGLCTLWSWSCPCLIVLECESANKGPLPQKRAERSILFQGMLSYLQVCTTLDNFALFPTEL